MPTAIQSWLEEYFPTNFQEYTAEYVVWVNEQKELRGEGPLPDESSFEKRGKNFKVEMDDEFGRRTGLTNGLLEEGWNPKTKAYEYHTSVEWDRMKELGGKLVPEQEKSWLDDEKEFPSLGGKPTPKKETTSESFKGTTPMHKLNKDNVGNADGVHAVTGAWGAGAEARLRIERKATQKLRGDMTDNLNKRTGKAKQGMENNCNMASAFAKALKNDPEMLGKGGIFSRIVGGVEGQGQHAEGTSASDIAKKIEESVKRLKSGKGEGDDGNLVMQFIGCFVDGLTEINEGNKTAAKQLDKLWPLLGLKDSVKEQLLNRVKGYKEIANASADTGVGKGTRKDDTRKGLLPNDPRHQIFDQAALIKGDVSGSMHSCLLAQELAETLFGPEGKVKEMGEPVNVKDKELLDARAADALAITAGGTAVIKGETKDLVFHTAYEMINGMRAITGLPIMSQVICTEIVDHMTKGVSFTDAVEKFYKPEELPWNV